jgi:hypothetical protein
MKTEDDSRHRQFFWGLSNGIIVLALATVFWFGIVAAFGGRPWMLPMALSIVVLTPALLFGAIRVRRSAKGFGMADLKRAQGPGRDEIQRIRVCFRWATLVQALVISLVVGLAMHYHREDLVWPGIGLGVSLHFLPLAWAFHVRIYYATAIAGGAISLAALLAPSASLDATTRIVFLGLGMGICMSATALYAALRANRLASGWDDAA